MLDRLRPRFRIVGPPTWVTVPNPATGLREVWLPATWNRPGKPAAARAKGRAAPGWGWG